MAYAQGNKGYLGIDTNILVAYLDHDHPDHRLTEMLRQKAIAVSQTIIHYAYHNLVFRSP